MSGFLEKKGPKGSAPYPDSAHIRRHVYMDNLLLEVLRPHYLCCYNDYDY
jgi:hypothetical protein